MNIFLEFPHKLTFTLFFVLFLSMLHAQENCTNGIDDDRDGLIDLKDPDCQCKLKPPYNLLQNPSFESYTGCPVHRWPQDANLINYWQHGTVDGNLNFYHNYKCPEDSAEVDFNLPPPRPLPDGTGYITLSEETSNQPDSPEKTKYKNYATQCLQTPLKKGVPYTFGFYVGFGIHQTLSPHYALSPFRVAVFGNADCSAVPFGRAYYGNGCPLNANAGWVLLGQTVVSGHENWVQGKIDLVIPFDIKVIAVGYDCSLPPVRDDNGDGIPNVWINFMDNFSLLETKDLNLKYISIVKGDKCNGGIVLKAPTKPFAGYQWYKDSVAITGATDSIYAVPDINGKGNYNVRITNEAGCEISEPLPISVSRLATLKFVTDTTDCKEQNTLIAPAIPGILYKWSGSAADTNVSVMQPGIYNITAYDSTGCTQSFTVNVRKQSCGNCEVFVPKAFTPNRDGINDVFKAKSFCGVDDYSLQVYNRWGEKIFEANDIDKGWDGNINGTNAPYGAYIYIVRYRNAITAPRFITEKGTFVLLR